MKVDKDTLERRFLDSFKAAYILFSSWNNSERCSRKELAGLIVKRETRETGIEVARLYRDDGKDNFGVQRQPQLQERVLIEARNLFEKASQYRFTEYLFRSKSEARLRAIDTQQLASYLSGIVLKKLEHRLPTIDYPIQIGSSCLYQHKEVFSSIYIDAFKTCSDCSWKRNNVNYVESLNEALLRDVIERKERKHEKGNYSACNKVWLLLCSNYFDPAMEQCIPMNLGFAIESSNFDKILLYKTYDKVRQIYPSE